MFEKSIFLPRWDESSGNLIIAQQYFQAGFSIVPLRPDGSKAPKIAWKPFQLERITPQTIFRFFQKSQVSGIGIICGKISGGLEVLDFDKHAEINFPKWRNLVSLPEETPIIQTPKGGFHVWWRCPEIEGNLELAKTETLETMIETRGEGGYFVAPGSPPATHPLNREYCVLAGNVLKPPVLSPVLRQELLNAARSFCRKQIDPAEENRRANAQRIKETFGDLPAASGQLPGNAYNESAEWEDILEPHGWRVLSYSGAVCYWQRPDKSGPGASATTEFVPGCLRVFSSNAAPFEAGKTYSKFAAFALLNHGGDFSEAAKKLSQQGFGTTAATEIKELERKAIEIIGGDK